MRYRTDEELEEFARHIRRKLGIEDQRRPDLMTLIVKLKSLPGQFDYKRVEDVELPEAEAQWDAENRLLVMRQSVFRGINNSEPRARFTVAHELSHFLLGHTGIRNRSTRKTISEKVVPRVRQEESEAYRFGAMLLAPAYLIEPSWTAEDIAERFGLSYQAALIRQEEVEALRRRATRQGRELPSVVVDFLKEAQRRGAHIRTKLD